MGHVPISILNLFFVGEGPPQWLATGALECRSVKLLHEGMSTGRNFLDNFPLGTICKEVDLNPGPPWGLYHGSRPTFLTCYYA